MSEPQDPDTESATEEEEVDLEALLEEFREPEPPPRKRGNPVWLILAVILSILAIWMVPQATEGKIGFGIAKAPATMKATKVRDRSAIAAALQGKDLSEDYVARCKKGLNSLEVRWIAEDFRGEGLDDGPGSLLETMQSLTASGPAWAPASAESSDRLEKLAGLLGGRQRAWYRSALADALRLDDMQRHTLKKTSSEAFQEDWESFEKSRQSTRDSIYATTRDAPYNGLLYAPQWLSDDRYAPWRLCQLSTEQLGITRYDEVKDKQLAVIGSGAAEDAPSWLDLKPLHLVTTEELSYEEVFGQEKRDASAVFPFAEGQKIPDEGKLLDLAKTLHPTQLKMMLLLEPKRAGELLEELEREGE
ncbi:hypothetical protein [Luteolibacter luteus]|uniref:Uncharacterized protein n=1 Tax=Luteolibacter luteus TaxID=2728835 RepID=A0A858RIN4_9BACT|nr:hypothetical protein [Luteolibacter luteus]QJE96575.1 hypothetical protein HHL09_12535 [Luteolibacter luteus]